MDQNSLKPIILDVGKKSKKAIKKLKNGEGELLEQANAAAKNALMTQGREGSPAITLVLLYEKKAKKTVKKLGLASLIPL